MAGFCALVSAAATALDAGALLVPISVDVAVWARSGSVAKTRNKIAPKAVKYETKVKNRLDVFFMIFWFKFELFINEMQ